MTDASAIPPDQTASDLDPEAINESCINLESLNPLFNTNPGDVTDRVCAVLEVLA